MWVTLAAIPLNALLAYALIDGALGLPRLDLLGAGLATTCVNLLMCAAAIWICYACRPFRKYRVLGRFWRPDWPSDGRAVRDRTADLRRLHAGMGAVHVGRAAGRLDRHHRAGRAPDRAAGRVAVSSWCRSAFRLRRRCASATRSAGAIRRRCGARASARWRSASSSWWRPTLLVIAFRDRIPPLFPWRRRREQRRRPRTSPRRCCWSAQRFFVTDGLQGIAAGALRGLNDTRVPMLLRRAELLADRLSCVYALALHGRPWRHRHLDRVLGGGRDVRDAADLALRAVERTPILPALGCGVPLNWTHPAQPVSRPHGGTPDIAKLGRRGDGIAETPAGPLYVPYTLPGEIVEVEPWPGHPDRRI